jgi:hypothetical protein
MKLVVYCSLSLLAMLSHSTASFPLFAQKNIFSQHSVEVTFLQSSVSTENIVSQAKTEKCFARLPQKNPKYPDLAFDKYLANPYFHKINTNYPGLQLIHEEPFVFIINDLLTENECSRLRQKATNGTPLRPQIGGGSVVRTSLGVVCTNEEVPSIRTKMMDLIQVPDSRQLQPLKVSKYQEGQTFSKHTDAWPTDGAPIHKGWVEEPDFFGDALRNTDGCYPAKYQPNHNTILTTFVYLNTVEGSGYTCFPNIGLHKGKHGKSFYTDPAPMDSHCRPNGQAWDWDYRDAPEPLRMEPQLGMAVLHFCSTVPDHGGLCDGNVFHIAERPAAGKEKFVSQQFVSSCPEWTLPEDSLPYGRVTWDTI